MPNQFDSHIRCCKRRGCGWTRIESIVAVVAVVLLLSLAIPMLMRPSQTAQIDQCLSNLGRIVKGETLYQSDHNGQTSFVASMGRTVYSNYNTGGRMAVASSHVSSSFLALPYRRPLNPYVDPDRPVGDASVPMGVFQRPDLYNFPTFRCPADNRFNYQETAGKVSTNLGAYEAVGTSYLFNCQWFNRLASGPWTTDLEHGSQLMKVARQKSYAPKFVVFYEEPVDAIFWLKKSAPEMHHGKANTGSLGFLDDHAAQTKIEFQNGKASLNTDAYDMTFPELLNAKAKPPTNPNMPPLPTYAAEPGQ